MGADVEALTLVNAAFGADKALITDAMKAAVEKAKAGIIDGSIKVHDYMADNSCPG